MMKAKLRVSIGGKRFETVLELPCLIPHLCIRVGSKRVTFDINESATVFDHQSGHLLLEPEGSHYTLEAVFATQAKALSEFYGDSSWWLQPNSD